MILIQSVSKVVYYIKDHTRSFPLPGADMAYFLNGQDKVMGY